MTGFLDLTLKCIDLDQGNKVFHLLLTCSKPAKTYTKATCHSQQ